MGFYEGKSDEELIARLRGGQQDITDYIMEKYKNLVRKRANAMYLMGGETEDLIQEGMIGLFKAIRDFKEDKDASFSHFADLCVSRQIFKAVEAARRKKHQPLNSYVSLNAQDDETGNTLADLLIPIDTASPEQLLIDQENVRSLEEKIEARLSNFEKEVLEHYLKGMNYREIAKVMEKQPKVIDNALQRIRGKLKEWWK